MNECQALLQEVILAEQENIEQMQGEEEEAAEVQVEEIDIVEQNMNETQSIQRFQVR